MGDPAWQDILVETETVGPDRQHELEFNATGETLAYGRRVTDPLKGGITVAVVFVVDGHVKVLRHEQLDPAIAAKLDTMVGWAQRFAHEHGLAS